VIDPRRLHNVCEEGWAEFFERSDMAEYTYEPRGMRTFPDFFVKDSWRRQVAIEVKSSIELVHPKVVRQCMALMHDQGRHLEVLILDGLPRPAWFKKLIWNPKIGGVNADMDIIPVWCSVTTQVHKSAHNTKGIFGHTFDPWPGRKWGERPSADSLRDVARPEDVEIMNDITSRIQSRNVEPEYITLGLLE